MVLSFLHYSKSNFFVEQMFQDLRKEDKYIGTFAILTCTAGELNIAKI